jgi:TM2 domain-containing membrane protein YozV|tara:strand:+ start:1952 stop:2260 length:309 start_codon:yes stop_codon:yes gene_type:complete
VDQNLRTQLQYDARKKSVAAAYILWLFLGSFGAHRFYLGRTTSGLVQLSLLLLGWIPFFLGWFVLGVWWLVDAFLIPGQAEQSNLKTLDRLSNDASLPAIVA